MATIGSRSSLKPFRALELLSIRKSFPRGNWRRFRVAWIVFWLSVATILGIVRAIEC
jgi:hypothetical protein